MLVPKDYPDHHDADLVLRLYEMRREPVMRESRSALNRDFWPKRFEDILAVTKRDHPLNAAYRQCTTYWEMVYGMAKHGVIHADFMLESNGEGLILYARVEPYLEQIREQSSPRSFQNAEWVANQTNLGRQIMETARKRVQQMTAAK